MFEKLKMKVDEAKTGAEKAWEENKSTVKGWGVVSAIGAGVLGLGALIGAVKGYNVGMTAGCRGAEAVFALFEPEAYGRVVDRADALGKLLK